ncbi:MAG: glycosyltransferase [Vallitalea sp.]|jgi:glycosyltransferase involved in cell wall biosynthesis|nr:glycosyltransferase [Vallitalea sp.]
MIDISIVIPVYNVEKYLHRCICSVLKQTFANYEIILVDDGSTDNSGSICDEYKRKDSRIKVIHKKNRGLSAARNTGIENAKSEFITFIDSDDFIHPKMLEILHCNIISYKADVSIINYQKVYENEKITMIDLSENSITLYNNIDGTKRIVEKSERNMIVAWGKLYRLNLFSDIKYPIDKLHEDEFVTYKLLYKSSKTVVSDAKLYFYFQRDNSITGNKYSIKRLEKLDALEEAIHFFEEKNKQELIYLACYRYLLNIQIAYYKVKYEMNNEEILDKLKIKYKNEFRILSRNLKRVNLFKKLLLRFFYLVPNIVCIIIRAFYNIRINER